MSLSLVCGFGDFISTFFRMDFIMRKIFLLLTFYLLAISSFAVDKHSFSDELQKRLDAAGDNKSQLLAAYDRLEDEHLEGFEYLVVNMPDRDLKSLKADLLVNNIKFAYKVMKEVPWAKEIPHEIFLDNILPYVNIIEKRDDWRPQFYKEYMPLVKDCKTISAAAEMLNKAVFARHGVVYSTRCPRTEMSPFETIECRMATCTGLSILLTDACRAVGVPARLAGIPDWLDNSGNHTWVEIWDKKWHFTGAAEPGKLNKTWFNGKAALAQKGSLMHSIYAVSFKKTDRKFPLSWSRNIKYINAVDNTDMYVPRNKKDSDEPMIAVRVWDEKGGRRVEAGVKVYGLKNKLLFEGTTKGCQADMNDSMCFAIPQSPTFMIKVKCGNKKIRRKFTSVKGRNEVIDIYLTGDN